MLAFWRMWPARYEAQSPRAALLYSPSESISIYAGLGDSFQLPGTAILGDGRQAEAIITEACELGVKSELFDDSLAVSVTAFDKLRVGELYYKDRLAIQLGDRRYVDNGFAVGSGTLGRRRNVRLAYQQTF